MALDEGLARRIRAALAGTPGLTERRMFGGICFLVHGNMCCGVASDALMLRVGPAAYESCLALPHAREMDFTGRPLKGYLYVAPEGIADRRSLKRWLQRATSFAETLPPKAAAMMHR